MPASRHVLAFHSDFLLLSAAAGRDLSKEKEEYRLEFGQVGVVQPLVGLLESERKQTTICTAEALAMLAQTDSVREAIR